MKVQWKFLYLRLKITNTGAVTSTMASTMADASAVAGTVAGIVHAGTVASVMHASTVASTMASRMTSFYSLFCISKELGDPGLNP